MKRDFADDEEPFVSFLQPIRPTVKGYTCYLRAFNRERARKRVILARIEASSTNKEAEDVLVRPPRSMPIFED